VIWDVPFWSLYFSSVCGSAWSHNHVLFIPVAANDEYLTIVIVVSWYCVHLQNLSYSTCSLRLLLLLLLFCTSGLCFVCFLMLILYFYVICRFQYIIFYPVLLF
jgi:hypothetical protein